MKKSKKALIAVAVLLAVLFVAGVTVIAVGTYGSESDPLVTQSYINETVIDQIIGRLDDTIGSAKDALSKNFSSQVSSFSSIIDGKLKNGNATPTTDTFSVVTLNNGQTVECEVGAEIMLRIGSAASFGSDSPRLVDETDGSSLSSAGTALVKNHMYMVTIAKNGIKATANNTKVLIRGSYTIK